MSFSITKVARDDEDQLPAFAWPGGYPLTYFTTDGEVLCASCATVELDELCEGDTPRDETLGLLAWWQVHWEGPDETCANCYRSLPSAYGGEVDG